MAYMPRDKSIGKGAQSSKGRGYSKRHVLLKQAKQQFQLYGYVTKLKRYATVVLH